MSKSEVLTFISTLAERWESEARQRGLERDDRAEMRAWAAAAKRVRSELDRAWRERQP